MGVVVFCGFTSKTHAQSLDNEIREMRSVISDLQKRLEALEAENSRLKQQSTRDKAVESQAVNERIEALEAEVEELKPADNDLNLYWKEGIRFDSNDGAFKLKLSGRVQADIGWFDVDNNLESVFGSPSPSSGTEFRRARLAIEGTIYDEFGFKAQYDFAEGDSDFKDVWMSANKVPVIGQLKVGHFKEPFSLDELTSSKYIMFMERALPNVFAPGRNFGVQASDALMDDRLTYAVGVFRHADSFGDSTMEDDVAVTGRITGLPWMEDKTHFLHVGGAASYRKLDSSPGTLRFRSRPEAHIPSDRYVDTNASASFIDSMSMSQTATITQIYGVDDYILLGGEVALVYGPWSAQGELILADINSDVMTDDPTLFGWYVQGSYFLTGESRAYKASSGTFDKVKPKKNFGFGEGSGMGAWEVAARWSSLDLDDGTVNGGDQDSITVGVNWYLNPNMKVMLNYIHAMAERDAITIPTGTTPATATAGAYDGDFDAIQARFQVFW